MSNNGRVFVYVQQIDGVIDDVSFELIRKAGGLAAPHGSGVTAVLLGCGLEMEVLSESLARFGADRVILVDDPALEDYTISPYAGAVAAVINTYAPEMFLFGATDIGRELAPRVAARVRTGLTADCTGLDLDSGGNLVMTCPSFGGKLMARIICPGHRPQMVTVRPGVMRRAEPSLNPHFHVERFQVNGLASMRDTEVLRVVRATPSKRVNIRETEVIVAGGRGMGGPKGFEMLEELALHMGGTVAASRAPVDLGWIEQDRQVGQTAVFVRPKLYIACGISGAAQHLVGMEESDVIVAVNKNPEAPIFSIADYGIVGDVFEIIPRLIKAVRDGKSDRFAAS